MAAINSRQETGEIMLVQIHEPSEQALQAELYDVLPSASELFCPLFESQSFVDVEDKTARATMPPDEVDVMEHTGQTRYTTTRQYDEDGMRKDGTSVDPVYICLFVQSPQQIGISISRFGSGYRVSVTEDRSPVYQYVLADDTLNLKSE